MPERLERERDWLALKKVSQMLKSLAFPSLKRPALPPGAAPTRDLANWAIRLYCFSHLAHYREMLSSFLLLCESGRIAAAFPIGRVLFEMGAHAYYVRKHVAQYIRGESLELVCQFLTEVNMGSLYMREEIAESEEGGDEHLFPATRHIAKVIRCFNEYGNCEKEAGKTYSFLSEFSHPNMAAFAHYYEWEAEGQGTSARFGEPPRDRLGAPLPSTGHSLVATLHLIPQLLAETGETDVAPQVEAALSAFLNSYE